MFKPPLIYETEIWTSMQRIKQDKSCTDEISKKCIWENLRRQKMRSDELREILKSEKFLKGIRWYGHITKTITSIMDVKLDI